MVTFEIPVGSEIANLVNFLAFDLVIIAIIMQASSKIAGMCNHIQIQHLDQISIFPFSIAHIGGGIVMKPGPSRISLILLRFSVIAAVCVSNFGLQGRSRVTFEERIITARQPGIFTGGTRESLFNVSEARMRCATQDKGELRFGAVLDGDCHQNDTTEVYIIGLGLVYENLTVTLKDCNQTAFPEKFHSAIRCENADLLCPGPFPDIDRVQTDICESIVYDGNVSWHCPVNSLDAVPGLQQSPRCRKIRARREDIKEWIFIYRDITEDVIASVFGSAYAVEKRVQARVPIGKENVTAVNLWWIVPALWLVVSTITSFVWLATLYFRGARPVYNDERALVKMLISQNRFGSEDISKGLVVNENGIFFDERM